MGCAVCAGCWVLIVQVGGVCGVLGAGAREGTQWHGVALPPPWGLWGSQHSGGADGFPAARVDGAHRAHCSPGHAGGCGSLATVTHLPLDVLLPLDTPCPAGGSARHPPPRPHYELVPCAARRDGTPIGGEMRCQHPAGAAALLNRSEAPAGASRPEPLRQEHPDPPHAAAVAVAAVAAADDLGGCPSGGPAGGSPQHPTARSVEGCRDGAGSLPVRAAGWTGRRPARRDLSAGPAG